MVSAKYGPFLFFLFTSLYVYFVEASLLVSFTQTSVQQGEDIVVQWTFDGPLPIPDLRHLVFLLVSPKSSDNLLGDIVGNQTVNLDQSPEDGQVVYSTTGLDPGSYRVDVRIAPGAFLVGGTLEPIEITTSQVIHPNGNASLCLSAPTNADGADVEIDTCSGASSQSWNISGSTIQIYGNKCLDVTNGNAVNGNKMQIWTCSTNDLNQEWNISSSTIVWSGTSFCLDNTGGVMSNANPTQIWTCNGGPNQSWRITDASGSTNHVISPGASSTTCLTAPTDEDGGAVVVEPCSGASSQSWTLVGSTIVIYGNKCLDVTNGSTANGNQMQIWTCTSGDINQGFSITADNRIAWTNHGECLDLTAGSLANGNAVQMWACTDNDNNQVWNIV